MSKPSKTRAPLTKTLTKESYVSSSVIEGEAKASLSQRSTDMGLPQEAPSPVTPAVKMGAQGEKKKEKKKKGKNKGKAGQTAPLPLHSRLKRGRKSGRSPNPKRVRLTTSRGQLSANLLPRPPIKEMRRDGILWSAGNKPARERPQRVTPKTLRLRWLSPGGGRELGKPSHNPSRGPICPPLLRRTEGKRERRRAPRTAAVVITCPPGQYKESIKLATEKIDLASLDINGLSARRAITGAQIFEVGGPDNKRKADALAEKISEVLENKEGVRVIRPFPTAEVRIRDLCDATEEEDVRNAVALAGGCDPALVKVGP